MPDRVPARPVYQPDVFSYAPAPRRSVQAEQSTRVHAQLIDAYQAWAGTPYQWGGNGPNTFDCSGLIVRVFRETFGMTLPRTTHQMLNEGDYVPQDALRVGDLVFFKPNPKGNHAGIYIGDGAFFHASSSRGVMQSRLDEPYWQRSYHEARRVLPWSTEPTYADTRPPRIPPQRTQPRAEPPVTRRVAPSERSKPKSARRGW
ncbi:MAG: hypothetical protein RhofKO_40850 [Rhodothermales bacterium]